MRKSFWIQEFIIILAVVAMLFVVVSRTDDKQKRVGIQNSFTAKIVSVEPVRSCDAIPPTSYLQVVFDRPIGVRIAGYSSDSILLVEVVDGSDLRIMLDGQSKKQSRWRLSEEQKLGCAGNGERHLLVHDLEQISQP